MTKQSMREALAVHPGPVELAGYDPAARPLAPTEKNRDLRNDVDQMRGLQDRLWAESTADGTRSILLLLQGIDTAGKGGVTEHVVGAFGPIGVQYTAFKAPTEEERAHDFLWRIRKRLPPAGVIGVFDRSHYEDVLIVRVHDLVPEKEWRARYDVINDFEAELAAAGTTILKCFLNISFEAQRDRLLGPPGQPGQALEVQRGRPRGAGALERLPVGVLGDAGEVQHRPCPVVRRAQRPQEVPQLGRR